MQSRVPKLVVLTKGKPREIEMGQELTIGRGYSNLLRLDGEEISRVHAIIYRRHNDFILRDLDSKNGVFLNGSKIAYAQLGPGDRLQVGKYKMIFNPPSDYDVQAMAEAGDEHQHPQVEEASPVGEQSGASQTSSGHQALNPAAILEAPVASAPVSHSREEVSFFTRQELENRRRELDDASLQHLAQLHDRFFSELWMSSNTGKSTLPATLLAGLRTTIAADRAVIVRVDPNSNDLSLYAIVSDEPDVAVNRIALRSGLSEGKCILCPDTRDSGLFRENDTVKRDNIATLLSVPLGLEEPFALLYLDRTGEAEELELGHLMLAAEVARIIEMHMTQSDGSKVETPHR